MTKINFVSHRGYECALNVPEMNVCKGNDINGEFIDTWDGYTTGEKISYSALPEHVKNLLLERWWKQEPKSKQIYLFPRIDKSFEEMHMNYLSEFCLDDFVEINGVSYYLSIPTA